MRYNSESKKYNHYVNIQTTLSILLSKLKLYSSLNLDLISSSFSPANSSYNSTFSTSSTSLFRNRHESPKGVLLVLDEYITFLVLDIFFELAVLNRLFPWELKARTLEVEFARVDLLVSLRGVAGTSVMTHLGTQCFKYLWKQQLQKTTQSFSCRVQISSRMALEAGRLTLSTIFWQTIWRSAPIVMLKSTAQPYQSRQYLPKVQMMSEKAAPMFKRFISWNTLTSLSIFSFPQNPFILETARFCRYNLQGRINFFSKTYSNFPFPYHFKPLISSPITLSSLDFSSRRRFNRIKILNMCGMVWAV